MSISKILTPLLAVMIAAGSLYAAANVDADDFIENASELNISEIESGKLAIEKATYPEVKIFAKKMINEYSENNSELRSIAALKDIELADDAALSSKAKAVILKQYDGKSFDLAYANNQVASHKNAIELYKKAAKSDDIEVRTFAVATLPKFYQNLSSAEALVSEISKNNETAAKKSDQKDE